MYAKSSNVELHRLSELTRPVFSLEIAVELRHGELSSCATYTLDTCNLLPRGLVLRPIQRKSKSFQVELLVRTDSTYRVCGTIPDEPWRHRLQFDIRYL